MALGAQGGAARGSGGGSGAAGPAAGPKVPQEAATARVRRAKRGSQFSDSMARLRAQGVLKEVVTGPGAGAGATAGAGGAGGGAPAVHRRLNRSQSQFQASMTALKQQWDHEDAPSAPGQSRAWEGAARQGGARGAGAAALAARMPRQGGPDAVAVAAAGSAPRAAPAAPARGENQGGGLEDFFFDGGAEPSSGPSDPSGGHWTDVSYTVVAFVCFEDGKTRESQEFPLWGDGEQLEVGHAVVTWEGLKLCSTLGVETLLLPYDKILLWTINSNQGSGEYFVDLTLEGDYIDKGPMKQVEWWTGNVLEIRCCTADTAAAEAFATSLKEVCQIISEVKLEELDLAQMTGSKIAKASRDMISSTTTFEDARARRISLAHGPRPAPAAQGDGSGGGAYMSSDLMDMLQPSGAAVSPVDAGAPKRKSMMSRMFSKK